MRILLVDDDPQVNEVIKATLEMLGHAVATAEDSGSAQRTSEALEPDITLVDYMLPGASGLEVLRQLSVSGRHAVRYLATGMADFNLLQQALQAGAASMLCKPYRLNDLTELLDLAALLERAVEQERALSGAHPNELSLTLPSALDVQPCEIARMIRVARNCGVAAEITDRAIPLIAIELMKNARTHGSPDQTSDSYNVVLHDDSDVVELTVSDHGPGFDFEKTVSRARTTMEKSRASGLQVVLALAQSVRFADGGRKVIARVAKTSPVENA